MNLIKVQIEKVKRGDLIPGFGGKVVADTLSTTYEGVRFWYDTDGACHYGGPDGCMNVYAPTVKTQAVGQSARGARHALLSGTGTIKGMTPQGLCPASRNAPLEVWESGTALASVGCVACRRMLVLVSIPRGKS